MSPHPGLVPAPESRNEAGYTCFHHYQSSVSHNSMRLRTYLVHNSLLPPTLFVNTADLTHCFWMKRYMQNPKKEQVEKMRVLCWTGSIKSPTYRLPTIFLPQESTSSLTCGQRDSLQHFSILISQNMHDTALSLVFSLSICMSWRIGKWWYLESPEYMCHDCHWADNSVVWRACFGFSKVHHGWMEQDTIRREILTPSCLWIHL